MKYVAITINTTIFGPTLGYMDGLPVRDKWEQFVTDKVTSMLMDFIRSTDKNGDEINRRSYFGAQGIVVHRFK